MRSRPSSVRTSRSMISDDLGRGQRLVLEGGQQLGDRRRLAAAAQRRIEVGDRRLVGLDRVVAGDARPPGEHVARRGVAALVWRAAELVVERPGASPTARGSGGCPPAARPRPPRDADQAATASGSSPTSDAAAAISARIVEQPAVHAPHAQAAQQRRLQRGRVQPRGDHRPAGRLRRRRARVRRGVDRHPVLALQPRRALLELLRLPRLQGQHDHRQLPGELLAVVPAQALADRLGRERERAGRVREQLDLHPLKTTEVSGRVRRGLVCAA